MTITRQFEPLESRWLEKLSDNPLPWVYTAHDQFKSSESLYIPQTSRTHKAGIIREYVHAMFLTQGILSTFVPTSFTNFRSQVHFPIPPFISASWRDKQDRFKYRTENVCLLCFLPGGISLSFLFLCFSISVRAEAFTVFPCMGRKQAVKPEVM
jgi:hypothetical protein